MLLAGLTKLSLLDYPEKISCIVFTQGCVFSCPFCHNPDLLKIKPKDSKDTLPVLEFFEFLKSRIGKLEAVTITGGEPTVHTDLLEFIAKIKELGFLVKLDSNGIRPDVLEKAIELHLVDYFAMDIKHTWDKYHLATGKKINIENLKKSKNIIQNSGLDYEFRTTVVPGIHQGSDFEEIGNIVKGAKNYYLQEFRSNVVLNPDVLDSYDKTELNLGRIKSIVEHKVGHFGIRYS
jgi:pyruvate formate lyase activating enzyme